VLARNLVLYTGVGINLHSNSTAATLSPPIMLDHLIRVLVAALVAWILFYVVSLFVKDGTIMKIVGIIIGLILLLYGLKEFGVSL